MVGGERNAPLEVVLEEGSDEVKASEVSQGSDGGVGAEACVGACVGANVGARGGTEACVDSNVGATGGVAETPESWASKWAWSIKSREDTATSRLLKGR